MGDDLSELTLSKWYVLSHKINRYTLWWM